MMLTQDRWLLPEGIEDIFPERAERLDLLGRRLMDRFKSWGYAPVMPPVVDFLDSLLVGSGHELDHETLKFSDPMSGRLIGLRADITPQVARIDARTARAGLPSRLCYIGSVVHGVTGHLEKSRNPIQVGAELYGHSGERATLEVVELMLETLTLAGVEQVHLDLGHVGVYRALTHDLALPESDDAQLFDLLQRKDPTDLDLFLTGRGIEAPIAARIRALLDLNGPVEVLESARCQLASAGDAITRALDELAVIADALKARHPERPLHIDLAELRGYHYHTGIVFAAYVPGQGREIARGGRYDEIGQAFGHARPAVGFSADLKVLDALSRTPTFDSVRPVFAPAQKDPALDAMMTDLRNQGRVVIQSLGGDRETPESLGCGQSLVQRDGRWQLL